MSNQWKLAPAAWLDPDSIQRGEILSAQAKKNSDFLGQQDRAARFSVPLYEHPDAAEVARLTAERDALQVLLTAADERADVLEELLQDIYQLDLPTWMKQRMRKTFHTAERASDHVKHYECIGKGGDYTVVAIAQGAGTLKGFNHYVYKNADGVHFVRDPEDFLSRMQIKP